MSNTITFNTNRDLIKAFRLVAVENNTTMADLLNAFMFFVTSPEKDTDKHLTLFRNRIINNAIDISISKSRKAHEL
jgi:hypothetical protein